MHFYKHMNGFFMHSITLPEKLTKQLVHLVGKLLELKRPSGSTWYVGLIKSGGKLILQPGWNDFASDNNISQNDHLVFKFVGESKFEVFIFESAGCEKVGNLEKDEQEKSLCSLVGEELPKEVHILGTNQKVEQPVIEHKIKASLLNKKMPSTDGEQETSEASNDSIPLDELRSILYQKGKLHKSKGEMKMQRPNIATKLSSKNIEESEETSSDFFPIGELHRVKSQKNKLLSDIRSEAETPLMKRPCKHPSKFPSTEGQEGTSLQFCYTNYICGVPRWTAEQKSRAQQLASKVQAKNPYFHKIVTKHNLTQPYSMIIPRNFSDALLKRERLDFIVYCFDQGKTWSVTSYFRSEKNQQTLQGPTWGNFVKENKLQLGDICVFELDKTAKQLTFVIQISRCTNILDS